jgi:hypothetical protein
VAGRIADIDQARTAVERRAWSDAYEAFRALDPSDLTPEDWERLSDSAWWTGGRGIDRGSAEGVHRLRGGG